MCIHRREVPGLVFRKVSESGEVSIVPLWVHQNKILAANAKARRLKNSVGRFIKDQEKEVLES